MAAVASVAWSIALQIAACVTIGSNFTWAPTTAQLLSVPTGLSTVALGNLTWRSVEYLPPCW